MVIVDEPESDLEKEEKAKCIGEGIGAKQVCQHLRKFNRLTFDTGDIRSQAQYHDRNQNKISTKVVRRT